MATRDVWPDGESPEDVEELRDRLVAWLIPLLKENKQLDSEAGGADTKIDWERAPQLAYLHLSCRDAGCSERPCLRKAVALALLEVCLYQQGAQGAEGQLRRGLSSYRQAIDQNEALVHLRSLAASLIGSDSALIELMPEVSSDGAVWEDCVKAMDDAIELARKLRSLQERLGARKVSLPLAKLRIEGRGRRGGHLLPAVFGYLREVGVDWPEIAVRLRGAPDGLGEKERGQRVKAAKKLADRFARVADSRTFDLADD